MEHDRYESEMSSCERGPETDDDFSIENDNELIMMMMIILSVKTKLNGKICILLCVVG